MERTYLMVKPDGVQRGLCGEIVSRFEKKGLKLIAMKLMVIPKETAENHYGEHKGKKFYDSLISYITSGPVLAMVWEGENAVSICRNMMGKTKLLGCIDAAPDEVILNAVGDGDYVIVGEQFLPVEVVVPLGHPALDADALTPHVVIGEVLLTLVLGHVAVK